MSNSFNHYCEYYYEIGEHQFIEGEHKEECPEFSLHCSNWCTIGTVPHEDMEVHKQECPLAVVSCEYYNVGFLTKMLCKDQEEHKKEEIMNIILMMTMQKLTINEQIN